MDGTVVEVFDGGSSGCLECEDVVQAAGFGKCHNVLVKSPVLVPRALLVLVP